ncbi:DUF7333 family protein [Halosegnis marinus]|uniref:Uncharacterized protein n=1 Tax=Halosegnis marinus TaxID=3034023 RepID=A0ABD5ZQK5_9EURY|nr:hypothetical protein [Halosegnis sp. DT85]
MEFDRTTTAAAFVAFVAVCVVALILAPIPMATGTILMMVAPSMLVFGLVCLALGARYGEHRAGTA